MSTGTFIVESALKLIGAHSIVAPADPESVELGKNSLNSMMQIWLSEGIDMGVVPLNAPGDQLSEPLDVTQAIIDNLALTVAPNFDNGDIVVSQTLRNNARRGFARVQRLYQSLTIPNKVTSSTLPRGAGNRTSSTFAGKGAALDSTNG